MPCIFATAKEVTHFHQEVLKLNHDHDVEQSGESSRRVRLRQKGGQALGLGLLDLGEDGYQFQA